LSNCRLAFDERQLRIHEALVTRLNGLMGVS
jgi:hypothetical protein